MVLLVGCIGMYWEWEDICLGSKRYRAPYVNINEEEVD